MIPHTVLQMRGTVTLRYQHIFLPLDGFCQDFDIDIIMVAVVTVHSGCVCADECGLGCTAELLTQHSTRHTEMGTVCTTFIRMDAHTQTCFLQFLCLRVCFT